MNIGQAARASGISAKMIRYYESIGLIPSVVRSESGYRHYGDADIHRLRFVRRARDLGFSVGQLAALLRLWDDRSRASAEVKEIALGHVGSLRDKARQLEEMAGALQHLADTCHGNDRPDCPIIDDLAGGAAAHHHHPPAARMPHP